MKIRNKQMLKEEKEYNILMTILMVIITILGIIIYSIGGFKNSIIPLSFWILYFILILMIWIHYFYIKKQLGN